MRIFKTIASRFFGNSSVIVLFSYSVFSKPRVSECFQSRKLAHGGRDYAVFGVLFCRKYLRGFSSHLACLGGFPRLVVGFRFNER